LSFLESTAGGPTADPCITLWATFNSSIAQLNTTVLRIADEGIVELDNYRDNNPSRDPSTFEPSIQAILDKIFTDIIEQVSLFYDEVDLRLSDSGGPSSCFDNSGIDELYNGAYRRAVERARIIFG
jgi:hypothetical protein